MKNVAQDKILLGSCNAKFPLIGIVLSDYAICYWNIQRFSGYLALQNKGLRKLLAHNS